MWWITCIIHMLKMAMLFVPNIPKNINLVFHVRWIVESKRKKNWAFDRNCKMSWEAQQETNFIWYNDGISFVIPELLFIPPQIATNFDCRISNQHKPFGYSAINVQRTKIAAIEFTFHRYFGFLSSVLFFSGVNISYLFCCCWLFTIC